jgi:hypothetical protein
MQDVFSFGSLAPGPAAGAAGARYVPAALLWYEQRREAASLPLPGGTHGCAGRTVVVVQCLQATPVQWLTVEGMAERHARWRICHAAELLIRFSWRSAIPDT